MTERFVNVTVATVTTGGFGVGSGAVADEFVSGRELSSAFYAEVVSPLPGHRRHSAALLGWDPTSSASTPRCLPDHG